MNYADANMTLVLMIASQIAQMPFDSLRYNCWDYATDPKLELAKYNYTSRIAHGLIERRYSHAWLEINGEWVEATTGEIIEDRTPYHLGYYGAMKWNPYKKNWKMNNS